MLTGFPSNHRVWCVDFEFETTHSVLPKPVCMVGRELHTGQEIILAGEALYASPNPFRQTDVIVAFTATAEAHCFLELGWGLPSYWIDLWVEAKRPVNGQVSKGHGLLDVMSRWGLRVRDAAHMRAIQTLVGTGLWTAFDLPEIVTYCREDVDDTIALFETILPVALREAPAQGAAALAQLIQRGTFMADCARIERRGIPFDTDGWQATQDAWDQIRRELIDEVDQDFRVYVKGSFSNQRFVDLLRERQMSWPTSPAGTPVLDDDTFRSMARIYPSIAPLRELRVALSQMRSTRISVDPDGRVRTRLKPYWSITGRSQPPSTRYPFGNARWLRSFISSSQDDVFVYMDYKSQEIGIAAYLSGDEMLAQAHVSGDPYMDFAVRARLADPGETKSSRPKERALAKVVMLAVQYGMGARSIAASGSMCLVRTTEILQRHKEAYPRFWRWSQWQADRIGLGLPAYVGDGWRYQIGPGSDMNPRSFSNWPIQSTGAVIMRRAVRRCEMAGLPVVATVHDALAFSFPVRRAVEMIEAAKHERPWPLSISLAAPLAWMFISSSPAGGMKTRHGSRSSSVSFP
jgi:DNA polymerase I